MLKGFVVLFVLYPVTLILKIPLTDINIHIYTVVTLTIGIIYGISMVHQDTHSSELTEWPDE